jgi:hypothetical protein
MILESLDTEGQVENYLRLVHRATPPSKTSNTLIVKAYTKKFWGQAGHGPLNAESSRKDNCISDVPLFGKR